MNWKNSRLVYSAPLSLGTEWQRATNLNSSGHDGNGGSAPHGDSLYDLQTRAAPASSLFPPIVITRSTHIQNSLLSSRARSSQELKIHAPPETSGYRKGPSPLSSQIAQQAIAFLMIHLNHLSTRHILPLNKAILWAGNASAAIAADWNDECIC
jgi:hypothetical protein